MSKGLKITLVVVASIIVVIVAGYNIAQRLIINKLQSTLTEEHIRQIDDILSELAKSYNTSSGNDNTTDNQNDSNAGVNGQASEQNPAVQHENREENETSIDNFVPETGNPNDSNQTNNQNEILSNGNQSAGAASNGGAGTNSENGNSGGTASGNNNGSETGNSGSSDINIEEVKKSVSLSDQISGMMLASKIDIGYVMELTKPGLTPEVKTELKEYAADVYTQDEINQINDLYSKYKHILTK